MKIKKEKQRHVTKKKKLFSQCVSHHLIKKRLIKTKNFKKTNKNH